MKKLTALFLAMLMVFVVAGCKKETKETATKKTDATPAPTATATPEETETPADAEATAEETTAPSEGENSDSGATVSSEEKTTPQTAETAAAQTAPADTGASVDTAESSATTKAPKAAESTEETPKETASAQATVSVESMVGTYNLTALEMDGQVAPIQGESPLTLVLNGDGTGTYGPNGQAISINWTYENNSVILTAPGKETPLTLLVQDGNLVQQGEDGNAIYTK